MGNLDDIDESTLGEEFQKPIPNNNISNSSNNIVDNNNNIQIPIDEIPFNDNTRILYPQIQPQNSYYPIQPPLSPINNNNNNNFNNNQLSSTILSSNEPQRILTSPYQNVNIVYQNQQSPLPSAPIINTDSEFNPGWTPHFLLPNLNSYEIEDPVKDVQYNVLINQQVNYIYVKPQVSYIDDALLIHISQCKLPIQYLNLTGCQFKLELLHKVISNMKTIKALNLSNCSNITNETIKLVSKSMPHLEEIHLNNCFQLTDDSICQLVEKCSKIRIISLSGCKLLTDRSILTLCTRLKDLVSICLNKIKSLTDKSLVELKKFTAMKSFFVYNTMISNSVLSELSIKWRDLEVLNIGKCINISDTSISTVAFHCHKLQKLFLQSNRSISKLSIVLISQNCPFLRVLRIDNCINLTDEAILTLESCKDLRILNISNLRKINEHSLLKVLPTLCFLEELYAYKNPRISNNTCMEISKLLPNSLKVIRIDDCFFPSDDGVIGLVSQCRNIRVLNLSHLTGVTNKSLEAISNNLQYNLRKLYLNNCTQIGDQGLISITNLVTLEVLRIDNSFQFSTVSLEHLSRLVELESLNITGMQNLLDATVDIIVNHCRKLTHLYLSNCVQLTDRPIPNILGNLLRLKLLRLDGCPNISERGFANVLYTHRLPLETLNLSDTTVGDMGFHTILSQCNLKELYAWNTMISDTGLNLISPFCQSLRVLRLDRNKHITDKGIKTIISKSPLLQTINIGHLKSVGDDSVYALSSNCPNLVKFYGSGLVCGERALTKLFQSSSETLKIVDLSRCKKVTDMTVIELSISCPNLQSFICTHLDSVTNPSIIKLAFNCRLLKIVNLEYSKNIGEIAILGLSTYCKQIQVLKVTNCPLVTDLAITGIGRECLSLHTLYAGGTSISNGAIVEIAVRENIYLDNLDLCYSRKIGNEAFIVLANNCISLKTLNLSNTNISHDALALFKNNCKLLKTIQN